MKYYTTQTQVFSTQAQVYDSVFKEQIIFS